MINQHRTFKRLYIILSLIIAFLFSTGVSLRNKNAEVEPIIQFEIQTIEVPANQKAILSLEKELLKKSSEIEDMKLLLEDKEKQTKDLIEYIEELAYQAGSLEKTVKATLSTGKKKPQKYELPPSISTSSYDAALRDGADLTEDGMTYEGVWTMTVYTASVEECGSDKGITASGRPVVPGYSIAIDNHYWKFGTKFYIEGIGIVEANDTGGAIKGKNRLDLCIMNKDLAPAFGRSQVKVWLINE